MGKIKQIKEVAISELKPYERNAKLHNDAQVEKIAKSIEEIIWELSEREREIVNELNENI